MGGRRRRQYLAKQETHIVLDRMRGEYKLSELCRQEGIAASVYYG